MQTPVLLTSYSAVPGSAFNNSDAAIIGPVLERLHHEKRDTPRDVVAAAQRPGSPLRPYFEWDNLQAAHEWRLLQAKRMLGAILIRGKPLLDHQEPKVASERPRVIVPEPEPRPAVSGWQRDPTARKRLVRDAGRMQALRKLLAWEREFGALAREDEALRPVLEAIRAARKTAGTEVKGRQP